MKPLNYDNSPCSPISSNCVIWQGPDLHCIKLCAGDTVSDVVANLATELCTIMEQLDITNYDLSCFNLVACPPNTFEALIQFLIEKICSLEGISSDPNSGNKSSTGCPDCLVSVASCFIVNNITSMQLIDYVNMIGQRVCNILTTITELQDQISELDVRVTVLENATAPTFTMPTIAVDCTLQSSSPGPFIGAGGAAIAIDLVLSALINDNTYGYCALRTALGLPAALQTAVASQCITSSSTSLVYGTPMATAYVGSWIGTPTTIADTLTDMWISICDIFDYLTNFNVTVTDTTTINLEQSAGGVISAKVQDTGWVNLLGFSSYMNSSPGTNYAYPQVRRIGNVLHFKGTLVIPLATSGSGANVLPWVQTNSIASYETSVQTKPFIGTGGVILQPYGSISFNRNAGAGADSVIPTSVLPTGYAIDGCTAGWKIFNRVIQIATDTSTMLSSLMTVEIDSGGKLIVGLVKGIEQSSINTSNNAYDTSHLNMIISHVNNGQSVPKFSAGTNVLHSAPNGALVPLTLPFLTASAGTYPFACNANDEDEVGGFSTSLDGLMVFISPCDTIIPTPNPCP